MKMEVFDECMGIIDKIVLTTEQITFKEDTTLQELMKQFEEGGKNQFQNAQVALTEAKMENEKIREQLILADNKYQCLIEQYEHIKEEESRLAKTPENANWLIEENLKTARVELEMLKKITNVYFDFDPEGSMLCGFIGIKDENKEESKFEPFMLNPNDPEVSSKIWEKMNSASL